MTDQEAEALIRYVLALEKQRYWDNMASHYEPSVARCNLGDRPKLPRRPKVLDR